MSTVLQVVDDDDVISTIGLIAQIQPSQPVPRVSKTGKRLGWPKRWCYRNGSFYKFYKIYSTLDRIIEDQKLNIRLNSELNFSDYEYTEIVKIREKLEELRKNRIQEYWKIKEKEKIAKQNI